ncbi:MAG: PKD domain-containing protein [Flavobacteriales bacterium]|nr:PKD domain-containing protein [Flavobacteriales bacterium]
MKKFIPIFSFLFLIAHLAWAQSSNDLQVSGYVTDATGAAVNGQWVCISYSGNNANIADSTCDLTNANGWYSITVVNGSTFGSNQTFEVSTTEYCQNIASILNQTISNQQGSADSVTADFALSCSGNSGGGCDCQAQITSTVSPNGNAYTFTAGVPCGSAPYTYQWWMPDGSESTSASPNWISSQSGAFGICVTIADANGCSFQTCDTIYVGGSGSCDAHFYYSSTPNGNVAVGTGTQFTYSGQGTNIQSYTWVVSGGGASMTSNLQDPSFVFPAAGIYNVCVTVSDGQGCTDTFCADVTAVGGNSGGCQAYFESTSSSNPNGNIASFTDYSTGNATNWFWDFGDGITSTQQNPVHNYQGGYYEVCLTIIDSALNMCSDTYCDSIYFDNNTGGGCQAYFATVDSSGYNYFVNYSQGSNLNYAWDFGDGNTSNATHPWHQYAQDGTYYACLTVIGLNCQDYYCDSVVIGSGGNGGCDAGFTYMGNDPSSPIYVFMGTPVNVPATYSWSFGDGSAGTGETITHQFPSLTGTYQVCLTMSIANTETCTTCQTITVGQDSCFGFISGQIFAGNLNQPIDQAIVYLITYDDQTGQLAAMQATVADSTGYYYFQSVSCGDYLIKAATTENSSFYSNHLPTYYGNSLFWEYAQEISVNVTMPAVQYDIILIAGNNPGGPGFIGGNVLQGANKVEADGEPLEGINVMLFDMAGNAVAYAYTDANGEFSFEGLAYGDYQVYAELLNCTTIPAVVSISAEEPMVEGLNIFVSEDLISTGIPETDFESLIGNIYPNPASDVATLSINLDEAYSVKVMVVDLTGRTISSEAVNLLPGINTHQLSVEGMGSGYYMLRISEVQGAFNVTRRFIVNR